MWEFPMRIYTFFVITYLFSWILNPTLKIKSEMKNLHWYYQAKPTAQ